MTKIQNLSLRIFIIFSLLFSVGIKSFSQSAQNMDSAFAAISVLPPEQIEILLKMAISSLPSDKRSDIEDALNAMELKSPEIKTLTLKNKTIAFTPIAHASTPEFYQSLKNIVDSFKGKGYIVYYEQVKKALQADSIDTVSLKFRKMMGIEPTRQTYSILKKFFPDVISQPVYEDLGVTKSDINADVTLKSLVEQYEKLYGNITLNQCDFDTKPGTTMYNCGKLFNDLTPVILDYRNQNVANLIKASNDKKILVIYGARHVPGIMKLLQDE